MSGILEQEFDNIRKYASKGRQIEAVKQEDGTFTAQKVRMGATGLDLTLPSMGQGEKQTIEQTKKEIGPSLAGVATGPAVGAAEVVDLGLGLVKGAYKAAFPDADEGRFESFMQTLGDQFESGYGEGARSMILDIGRRAGYDEEQLKVMDEGITAGSFFGYGGAVKAAPKAISALGDAVEGAGDAAKARMADADGSVTLTSGVDPDPAIAAAGDAVAKFRAPTKNQPGTIAFHGSGADFDEFQVKYIGTGEGAQAYGYGLYFTESEDIAKYYRDTVQYNQRMRGNTLNINYQGKPFEDLGDTAAAEAAPPSYTAIKSIADEMARYLPANPKMAKPELAKERLLARIDAQIEKYSKAGQPDADVGTIELQSGGTLEELILADLQQQKQALLDINSEDIQPATGKIYKVGLEPKPEDMIDYQTTFADQPKKIQDALKAVGYEVETNKVGMKVSPSEIRDAMRMPMSVIIDRLKKQIGSKELSEKLLEQGVPGIKYRAAGSRGANVDAADAKMNYVVFDDKMIKILEKYGIVGPVAITGVAATQQEGKSDGTGA